MKIIKKQATFVFILWAMSICVFSQSEQTGNFLPVIRTDAKEAVSLYKYSVDVKVVGNIATTTCEMLFYNKENRVLEGELVFPLSDYVTISRFALEVNGKLREGVPVEKNKGQQVFETIERRSVDPGLLEHVQGNAYRARIYPIPANGHKRALIAFQQELNRSGNKRIYELPLFFDAEIHEFSLNINVYKQHASPVIITNIDKKLSFKKWEENYSASAVCHNISLHQLVKIALPDTPDHVPVFVEKGIRTDKNYFYVEIPMEQPLKQKKLPNSLTVFWDVSSSAENRMVEKDIEFLKHYIKVIKNVEVELVFFANEIISGKTYSIKQGNADVLLAELDNVNYDGGTQFSVLDFSTVRTDEILLFSDGMGTFGNQEIKLGKVPVIAVNSSLQNDASFLEYVTGTTGGQYINLATLKSDEALQRLTHQHLKFISAGFNSGVSEFYPAIPTKVNGYFTCAGILNDQKQEITLNFGYGNEIVFSKAVQLSRNEIHTEGMVESVWAQKKLQHLDRQYEKNKKQIAELGKIHALVTRNTSLIVLETVEDYLLYEIVPPDELRDAYFSLLKTRNQEKENAENEAIEHVVKLYQEKMDWWNKKFEVIKVPPMYRRQALNESDDSSNLEGEVTGNQSVRRSRSALSAPSLHEVNEIRDDEIVFSVEEDNESISKSTVQTNQNSGSIFLKPWDPKAPYLEGLDKLTDDQLYEQYLKRRKDYRKVPSFYTDFSDYFMKRNFKKHAVRILSNLSELKLLNHELLRVLAHRLEQMDEINAAIEIYKKVMEIRAEEPQSYRDLALAYEKNKQYQLAADMLYNAIKRKWDGRFPGIETILVTELNEIIVRADSKMDTGNYDNRLLVNLPVDIRVVLNWDADNTDMDLWITDPTKEKCYYQHKLTAMGGQISNDFTGGYGPEEFMLRNAKNGNYLIEANYYGTSQQKVSGPVTIYLQLFLHYGKSNQELKEITLRLSDQKEVIEIGKFEFVSEK